MSGGNKDFEIATILAGAWDEYVALYGEPPHGTLTQLHSMLALKGAGRRIAELFSRPGESVDVIGAPTSTTGASK